VKRRAFALLLAGFAIEALAAPAKPLPAPAIDHHQHLLTKEMAEPGQAPIDAKAMIAMLDAAGIRRAVLLSNAFRFGNPNAEPAKDEYARVIAENDWTAREAARYPQRLIAFCSFNPLKDYAL
jgi:predicted TIM-barrel fold metal-dependent hydrolase